MSKYNGEIINFEISASLYKKIESYADFFCMPSNRFMQMLLVMGICEYNKNGVEIKKSFPAKEAKKLLRGQNQELERLEVLAKFGDRDKQLESEYLKEEIRDTYKEINKLATRCKIRVSEDVNAGLDIILKVQRNKGLKISKTDVICTLISRALDKYLKYLEDVAPYELKVRDRRTEDIKYADSNLVKYTVEKKVPNEEKNKGKRRSIARTTEEKELREYVPQNEESYWRDNKKSTLSFKVSELFYNHLENEALKYNVKPEDYIKILIEKDFSEKYK